MIEGEVEHGGCRLSYKLRGNGPPVVLIQGTGLHGEGWLPQVEGLAGDYQCLTFDNRGMGRSVPTGNAITVEQMARDTLAVMDAAGWDSAHLVGHSLGGLIALEIALTARSRVKSLALLCTFSRGRDATRMTPAMAWLGLRTYLGTRAMRRRAFLEMVMPPGFQKDHDPVALAERLAPLFGHDLADHPPIVMKQLAAMRRYDATPRLAELKGIPTLVVAAEHDFIARREYGKALAKGISGSNHIEIAGASHGVTIVSAEMINGMLKEHLGRAAK